MEAISFKYRFILPSGTQKVFDIELDALSLDLIADIPNDLPEWTKLEFRQCPNCTLDASVHPHCPLIARLVDFMLRFEDVMSYDEIDVEVTMEERRITRHLPAQRGISSMMGLVIGACGCPHTVFFKPMARFHLPFSNKEETIFRAASAYLLAQYFLAKDGKEYDLELKGLDNNFQKIQVVNRAIAERMRVATASDSSLNALVLLDLFTRYAPTGIEQSMEDIRYLFAQYLSE